MQRKNSTIEHFFKEPAFEPIPFQIAQDLSGRIAVATGMARYGDYRDELEELIQEHFPSK
jgi:hypothetical protein